MYWEHQLLMGWQTWPTPHLGICLVLAIYNINSCLPDNHLSTHYPTQHPNSIHTASSLLALSTNFSLSCSISWITNFQFLRISLDTLAHGDGYLTLTPIDCTAPTLGGGHSWNKFHVTCHTKIPIPLYLEVYLGTFSFNTFSEFTQVHKFCSQVKSPLHLASNPCTHFSSGPVTTLL